MNTQWHYAVVVGIDEYPGFKLPSPKDLHFPLHDAQEIHAWLTDPHGGNITDASHIRLITRNTPANRHHPIPLDSEIKTAIMDLLEAFHQTLNDQFDDDEISKKAAWKQSRFYFYISGHGIDGTGNDVAIVTANARPAGLENVSIQAVLNHLQANNIFAELVILADCCREFKGGKVQDLPWILDGYQSRFSDDRYPTVFKALASRTRKQAHEPPPGNPQGINLSIFTHVLLKGLKGEANQDGHGVTSESLTRYLRQYVPALSQQVVQVQQDPDVTSAYPDILFSARVSLTPITLNVAPYPDLTPHASLQAVITEGASVRQRFDLQARGNDTYDVTLSSGNYLVIPAGSDPFAAGTPALPIQIIGGCLNV